MKLEVQAKGAEVGLLPALIKRNEWVALAIVTDGKPTIESIDLRTPAIAIPREFRLARPSLLKLGIVFPGIFVASALTGVGMYFVKPAGGAILQDFLFVMLPVTITYWGSWATWFVLNRRFRRRVESMRVF